jgi:hypothetical protein
LAVCVLLDLAERFLNARVNVLPCFGSRQLAALPAPHYFQDVLPQTCGAAIERGHKRSPRVDSFSARKARPVFL